MMSNCRITLLNVTTLQDDTTGERVKKVVEKTSILGQISSVGMQTYWSATANNVKLSCVFTVRRRVYNNQKYVFSKGNIYEVNSVGKSSGIENVQLNAVQVNDTEIEELIKSDLGKSKTSD